jgi:hypothetical protein
MTVIGTAASESIVATAGNAEVPSSRSEFLLGDGSDLALHDGADGDGTGHSARRRARDVGRVEQVLDQGRLAPVVLGYVRPDFGPIDTVTAARGSWWSGG